jgi:outer membrane protein assembly factor BamB
MLSSIVVFTWSPLARGEGPADGEAERIVRLTGLDRGVAVVVGLDDGGAGLAIALARGSQLVVEGVDVDPARLAEARERFAEARTQPGGVQRGTDRAGRGCEVFAARWDGRRLPYVEHFINLLVLRRPGELTDEMLRTMVPGGAICARDEAGRWQVRRAPRRPRVDDWTHFLHNPTGNAVSHDEVVAPPRRLQWIAAPRYSRHHDHMSSASAMVSAGGKVFYLFDHASAHAILLPSDWRLVARDAYNGTVLWERRIERWHHRMQRLKSGPASLTRRLVATDEAVFVTLGLGEPVDVLDANTGRTIRRLPATEGTEEILHVDDKLLLVINPEDPKAGADGPIDAFGPAKRRIACVDIRSGQVAWSSEQEWVSPGSLACDGMRVAFYDGQRITCLDKDTGMMLWRSEALGERTPVPSYFTPSVVIYQGVVLFSGADTGQKDYHVDNGKTLTALSAINGKTLWQAPHPPSGYRSAEDVLVIDELVYSGDIMHVRGMKGDGAFTGRDVRTGEVKVRFTPDVPETTYWFHHRCYRSKATCNYLLTSRTGIEFVDPKSKHWELNHWVRGACLYGVMPANGMVYSPPHPCACYLEAKMYGFNALAPASARREALIQAAEGEGRLSRGPAYDAAGALAGARVDDRGAWPTLRGRADRAGRASAPVPADLDESWRVELGGRITAPVAAGGRVYVARIDEHTLHCLDARRGEEAWAFVAGGRIDSPPTVRRGLVYFGCGDGRVYCLRASDGARCWTYRAAPADLRHGAFEQVESVWPVHGAVLVRESGEGKAVVWAVAGRSMFVDGGLRLVRLDAARGELLSETVMDDRDPESGAPLQQLHRGLNMPVALPDVLVDDGRSVYMRSQEFAASGADQAGRRVALEVPMGRVTDQYGESQHLFCPTGLLDGAGWHRSYWVYGKRWKSGAGGYYQAGRAAPAGRPLVFDDEHVYGFARKPTYYRWTSVLEYRLYRWKKQAEVVRTGRRKRGFTGTKPPTEHVRSDWGTDVPLLVTGLVLADRPGGAGRSLLLAGAPHTADEKAIGRAVDKAGEQLVRQARALRGEEGGLFYVASAEDGSELSRRRLPDVPVFDGLAAAYGRAYVSLADGSILCLSPRE